MARKKDTKPLSALEKFQVVVAVFVSLTTAFIGWKMFELNKQANINNERLKEIETRLSERKFDFEQFKDIYDRTEKYLSSEQDEKRGRALVILVSAIPESKFRAGLLSILTVQATQGSVSTAAAESYVGASLPSASKTSKFIGTLQLQALQDGRTVTTLSDISFVDSRGATWTVPKGTQVTGASIPRIAWSAIGSPLEGKFKIPSVFHEYFTTQRTRSYQDVNRMFYEALIASGVDQLEAKVLYVAVQNFGPRFEGPAVSAGK
jgi:hypothetical protein